MKKFSILHIADIHFNEILHFNPSSKTSFSRPVKKIISYSDDINTINRALISQMEDTSVIIFSGDLCTQGPKYYRQCLSFINEKIANIFLKKNDANKILFVSGNHDLDRNKSNKKSLIPKFEDACSALEELGFTKLPVENFECENFPITDSSSVKIIPVNSCLACGEKRSIDLKTANSLKKLNPEIFKSYYEIEAPLIKSELFSELNNYIDDKSTPVIVAHHNLLPMRILQIKPYSELINGGLIRQLISQLDRPVLYIHGHIHEDLIEIIENPEIPNLKIVCISSPPLYPTKISPTLFGFQKIILHFTDNGVIIGCEVILFTLDKGKLLKKNVKIKLFDKRSIADYLSHLDMIILDCMKELSNSKGGTNEFHIAKITERYCEKTQTKMNELKNIEVINKMIETHLSLFNWLGFVEYDPSIFDDETEIGARLVKCGVIL